MGCDLLVFLYRDFLLFYVHSYYNFRSVHILSTSLWDIRFALFLSPSNQGYLLPIVVMPYAPYLRFGNPNRLEAPTSGSSLQQAWGVNGYTVTSTEYVGGGSNYVYRGIPKILYPTY